MIFLMDNQLPSAENMSVSEIAASVNVKEMANKESRNNLHIVILICMIIFAILFVGLSVINFEGFIKTQNVKIIHAQNIHSQDVQKFTNQ